MVGRGRLLALGTIGLLAACAKPPGPPVAVPVGFLLPVRITPTASTIRRGDTLWLEASFSDSLLDKNSGRRYRCRLADLHLTSYISYQQLLGPATPPVGSAALFRVVEQVGRAPLAGPSTGLFEPVYDGRQYRARIGLVPQQPGVMALSMAAVPPSTEDLGRAIAGLELPAGPDGQPRRAVLDDSFYVINEGKNTNFGLFSRSTRAYSLVPTPNPGQVIYEQQSTFTVEVQ